MLVKVLDRLFSVSGLRVDWAPDGEAALARLEATRPDLVVLDGMLPGISGFELLRVLKEKRETRDIPVIFLTAQDREEDIVRGLSMGASDYIVKPFKPRELVVRILRALPMAAADPGTGAGA